MSNDIFLSGTGEESTEQKLAEMVNHGDAGCLFFASAYVTYHGVDEVSTILEDSGLEHCAAVFGLDGCVTQPAAIDVARNQGWTLRLSKNTPTFHPKLALTGSEPPRSFSDGPIAGYIGSANFTKGGFKNNIEAGLVTKQDSILSELNVAANDIWELATPVEKVDLEEYSSRYAKVARSRTKDSTPPGAGGGPEEEGTKPEEDESPPEIPSFDPKHATAAWIGLQSSTGEYRFQPEFPKKPAGVVKNFLGGEGEVEVLCSDGKVRTMQYGFYRDNSMFRLNIPKEVPGVETAMEDKTGIAVVEKNDSSDVPIQLSIIHDEEAKQEIIQRSFREGTWGETSTRLYGWF